ncbi:MAG: hypothetical protein OXU27_02395 [Candidatus Poribacteria bacterium]|nr:hypothetical protein [Candidatus Poribacteria bacterium]
MKNVFTGKVVIGAFIIVGLFVAGSILWSRREIRLANEQTTATRMVIQKMEIRQSKPIERPPEQINTEPIATTEVDSVTEETAEVLSEMTDAVSHEDPDTLIDDAPEMDTEVATDEDERASLFGFGPYPVVPLGLFPHGKKVWDEIEHDAERDWAFAKDIELMVRVRIKLWELGTETVGASSSNGLIYPSIPNVAYVEWGGWREDENGEPIRTIKRITSAGGLSDEDEELMMRGGTPPGWTIMDRDTAGIDPYTFLELGQ